MFSYFGGSVYNPKPDRTIDFIELIEIIKTNPNNYPFDELRSLNKKDGNYKKIKSKLPHITPNCVVKESKFSDGDFDHNFIQSSGYIYLDIDLLRDVNTFKGYFVERYGNLVSMVSISCGGKGISILIRVSHDITSIEEYYRVCDYIICTYFSDEDFDMNAIGFNGYWFISYDPNVYHNENSIVDISESTNWVNQRIKVGYTNNNTLNYPLLEIEQLSLQQLLQILVLKTQYQAKKDIEFHPIPFVEIKFPRNIKKPVKRKVYGFMVHALVFLNPEMDPIFLFAYIYQVDKQFSNTQMNYSKLLSLFNFHYHLTLRDDYSFDKFKIKNIHFGSRCKLSGDQKRTLANKLNGKIRQNNSKIKIAAAIKELENVGEKVTEVKLEKLTGITRKTIRKHLKNLKLFKLGYSILNPHNK
jgi:hypothetical protein